MTGMWFTPETLERIRNGIPAATNVTPVNVNEELKKKEVARLIEEAGRGECVFCEEEIVRNDLNGFWESDFLLAFCDKAMNKDGKHKPIVRYSLEEGVVPVERNDQAHAESVQHEVASD